MGKSCRLINGKPRLPTSGSDLEERDMKRLTRILALALAVCMMLCTLCGCGSKKTPMATLTLEDGNEILIYLYPDKAPNTVANFISLANSFA